MSKKKSLLLKAGILLSLIVANVVAATPGSGCTIEARTILGVTIRVGGRVSANGASCVAGSLPDILSPLGSGVRCGARDTLPGLLYYTVSCPN
jgi:hypothetical protein